MLHLTIAADRIDCWIRRHIVSCDAPSNVNGARDRYVGLHAIGKSLRTNMTRSRRPSLRLSRHSSNNSTRRASDARPPGHFNHLVGGAMVRAAMNEGHPRRCRFAAGCAEPTHIFDLLCRAHGIEHRLTKPNHPWTNGQVERMNRTLKEATVRRYHYDSHHQLRQHIQTFLDAYNFAKRLKTLNGLTPFESVCKAWTKEPNRFKYDPVQLTSGLHT